MTAWDVASGQRSGAGGCGQVNRNFDAVATGSGGLVATSGLGDGPLVARLAETRLASDFNQQPPPLPKLAALLAQYGVGASALAFTPDASHIALFFPNARAYPPPSGTRPMNGIMTVRPARG